MAKQCSSAFCQNINKKGRGLGDITFHSFPKDPKRRARWKYLMQREQSWSPKDCDVVCSQHFCLEDFDKSGQTVRLREDAEPALPKCFHKKSKATKTAVDKKVLESHTDVETQDMSSSNIPDFHTYSVSVDGLLQKLRKVEDLNESLQKEIKNSKIREKHFTNLILLIKQELEKKNCLTEELEGRLSSYQNASEYLCDNSMKPFNPELVEIKSEPVGEAEEECQNGDLQEHKPVEIKCESSGDVQDHEFVEIKYTSAENNQVGAFEMEDPLIMKEEAESSIEHCRLQHLEAGRGVTRDDYEVTYNMASYVPKSTGSFCSAYGCSNNKRDNPEKSFFRFPKDQERCQLWVHCSRREDLQGKDENYLYDNCRLCGDHFSEDMFMNSSKKKLVWNAIPKAINVTATTTSMSQET